MKVKNIMNDNKGFSLVELIVTVLITAILMIAVIAFITGRSYNGRKSVYGSFYGS